MDLCRCATPTVLFSSSEIMSVAASSAPSGQPLFTLNDTIVSICQTFPQTTTASPTSRPNSNTSSTTSSLGVGIIAGVAAGLFCLFLLIALFVWRRRKANRMPDAMRRRASQQAERRASQGQVVVLFSQKICHTCATNFMLTL